MNLTKRREIFKAFDAHNAEPVTELHYNSTFELLIAVMLSAQMTDKGVNKATNKLFPLANTPEKILALGDEKLSQLLRSINYYKAKTRHVLQTCQLLIEKFNGTVPGQRQDLESLPGVGRKTANVILSIAFNQPTIAVDTHIFRVANRTKLAPGKNPREVEDKLNKAVPKEYLQNAHHWLVLHGRYVCTARQPKCGTCIIQKFCEHEDKNL
ncbi:MAG TPA: endonuclease III [Gammaproteobacteria bacterium]|nr:endonuclease III [Gammaproteobacteria bacterium]